MLKQSTGRGARAARWHKMRRSMKLKRQVLLFAGNIIYIYGIFYNKQIEKLPIRFASQINLTRPGEAG